MVWTIRYFACLWVFCIFRRGGTALITQECPAQFVDGEIVQMTCTVDKSAVSQCLASPTNLVFSITAVGGSATQLCQANYDDNAVCSSDTPATCACTVNTATSMTFVYNFTANKEQQADSKFECRLCATTNGVAPPPSSCDKAVFGGASYVKSSMYGIIGLVIIAVLLMGWTPVLD